MKAMIIQQYGEPDVLTLADLPVPEPAAGEVRLRVQAVSVNPVDYKWRRGGPFRSFPVVLGWDVCGVVDALGPGVTDLSPGDEVFGMVRFPQEGRAYAEFVTAPEGDLARRPPSLGQREAAALALAPLTAHQAFERMDLQSGQRVLIHAAAGGVGHLAVQLARVRGARVIATASARNTDFVRGLGADEVVDYLARPFEEQVRDVDAVLDTVGGDTLTRSYGVLRRGGVLISIAGHPAAEHAQQWGVQAERLWVHPSRAHLELLGALAESGELRPHISRTLPLEEVADAHRALETGRTVGKIVLDVG